MGAPVAEAAPKFAHGERMLSLTAVKTQLDLERWHDSLQARLGRLRRRAAEAEAEAKAKAEASVEGGEGALGEHEREAQGAGAAPEPERPPRFVVEPKIDGLAVALHYVEGRLVAAVTRGDGRVGELVTRNAAAASGVPERLGGAPPRLLEVRGEVLMTRSALERHNTRAEEAGEPRFANARNAASGSLRLLDGEEAARRELSFFAYALHAPPGEVDREACAADGDGAPGRALRSALDSQESALRWLAKSGFSTAPGWSVHESFVSASEAAAELIGRARDGTAGFDFDTDGAVLKVDDAATQGLLGATSSEPRWAVALKPPARQATTLLEDLSLNVGRSGHVVPVAHVEGVEIGGARIGKASLHNVGHALRLGLRVGDTLVIERAGDVIPRVLGPVEGLRGDAADAFQAPQECPACAEPLDMEQHGPVPPEWREIVGDGDGDQYEDEDEDEEASASSTGQSVLTMWCRNHQCPARSGRALQHFAKALKVGLGDTTVDALIEAGIVSTPPDFFGLAEHRQAIEAMPRMGEKRMDRILSLLDGRRARMTPADVIAALGIPGVSSALAARLAEQVGTLTGLAEVDLARVELDGAGEASVVKAKLTSWLATNRGMVRKLAQTGLGARDPLAEQLPLLDPPPTADPAVTRLANGGPWAGKRVRFTGAVEGYTRAAASRVAAVLGGTVVTSSTRPDVVVVGDKPGTAATKWPDALMLSSGDFVALASEHGAADADKTD